MLIYYIVTIFIREKILKSVEKANINEIILSCLSRNARMSAREISNHLSSIHIKLSPRAVLKRIKKLENDRRIRGYTIKISSDDFSNHVMRLILISFRASKTLNSDIRRFNAYLQKAGFVALAARTRGEYDWVNIKIFPNDKLANEESDTYRTLFGHVTERYTVFDLNLVKNPDFVQPLVYKATDYSKVYHDFMIK